MAGNDTGLNPRFTVGRQLQVILTLEHRLLLRSPTPFHPQRGAKFVLTTRKSNWGEDRVMYFDAQGKLRSMLASWTSVGNRDLFTQACAGRSWFRVDDLLKLCAQIAELEERKRS